MNIKKALALTVAVLILGAGIGFADNGLQKGHRNIKQNRVKSNSQTGPLFMDENGDGICDFALDHDGDGIPNRQDPDWSRPQDGSGLKKGNRNNANSSQLGNRNGFRSGNTWKNNSFRQNRNSFGNSICNNSGPKGKGAGKGQRRGR